MLEYRRAEKAQEFLEHKSVEHDEGGVTGNSRSISYPRVTGKWGKVLEGA